MAQLRYIHFTLLLSTLVLMAACTPSLSLVDRGRPVDPSLTGQVTPSNRPAVVEPGVFTTEGQRSANVGNVGVAPQGRVFEEPPQPRDVAVISDQDGIGIQVDSIQVVGRRGPVVNVNNRVVGPAVVGPDGQEFVPVDTPTPVDPTFADTDAPVLVPDQDPGIPPVVVTLNAPPKQGQQPSSKVGITNTKTSTKPTVPVLKASEVSKKDQKAAQKSTGASDAANAPDAVPSLKPETSKTPSSSTTATVDAEPARSTYRFKPGDYIKISVWGEDMTEKVKVQPDGFIAYQLVGAIQASGKTLDELRDAITDKLKRYFKRPTVSVIPQGFDGNFVTVLGAVKFPGRKVVSHKDRLLDALAQAGGVELSKSQGDIGEIGNLNQAYMARGEKILDIDFVKLIYEGDMSQNIPVEIGDFVYIPSAANLNVYVTGEVTSPQAIVFRGKPTVYEVITKAGGLRRGGYEKKIFVVRGRLKNPKVIPVNYKAISLGKVADVELKPGDIVHVPANRVTKLERISTQIIPFLNTIIQTDSASRAARNSSF